MKSVNATADSRTRKIDPHLIDCEKNVKNLTLQIKSNQLQDGRLKKIFLIGNPNSGKTTLFNALTGLHQKTANYPGVTVERREGKALLQQSHSTGSSNKTVCRSTNEPLQQEVIIIDLPGIYSLSSLSLDEEITTRHIMGFYDGTLPDAIVLVVDANNLERNLYLATQILDLEFPAIIALTMNDLAEKRGFSVKKELLSKQLGGIQILEIQAQKSQKKGIDALKAELSKKLIEPEKISLPSFLWLCEKEDFQHSSGDITTLPDKLQSWSSKLKLEKYIQSTSDLSEKRKKALTTFFMLELLSDSGIEKFFTIPQSELSGFHNEIINFKGALQNSYKLDPFSFESTKRYQWISSIIKTCCAYTETSRKAVTEKLDALLTHKIAGLVIFAAIMFLMFQSIFLWASYPMEIIDASVGAGGEFIKNTLPEGLLRSLLVDGIIAGVGSVLVFIPQIGILFFFLGLLEDSGYLARAAFIMDRVMRKAGLQGRSFIPLLSSFACAIPGIMATRTIPSFADRLTTIMVAPLMICSARLPVYTILIAAFIPNIPLLGLFSLQGVTLALLYFAGIAGALAVAKLFKVTKLRGEPALFVMEMPPFRAPSLKLAIFNAYERIIMFLRSAGSIILACSVLLWFLASFPGETVQTSFAGMIGRAIEPVIKPLGFNWEIGIALLASFAAREVFVSSLATIYNLQDAGEQGTTLIEILKVKFAAGEIPLAAGVSLMVFYIYACQCMSTLAVVKRETGSWKWVLFMFGYMTGLAYVMAFIVHSLVKNIL
jgi:ferrous iron transport protein B